MRVKAFFLNVKKRHPIRIARGLSEGSTNLFVEIEHGGVTGLGEGAPGTGDGLQLPPDASERVSDVLRRFPKPSPVRVWREAIEAGLAAPVVAALDIAQWDWLARKAGLPLHELFGLELPTVATSVTVGIASPEEVRERCREVAARTGARAIKLKLGGADGMEADRARFEAAREALPEGTVLRVDANGGWSLAEAASMLRWLGERGCEYVEQPLAAGREEELAELAKGRPLPIFADESCRLAADVPRLADRVDGVNVKTMKSGGLTEALRIVAVARAHGLRTMIGCMGESSVSIAASASIASLFDFVDLDSHLNLAPDPGEGTRWQDGVVLPGEGPGHGVRLRP